MIMGVSKDINNNTFSYKWTVYRILIIVILSIVFIFRYTSGYEMDNHNKSILMIIFFPLLIQLLVSHDRSATKERIKRNKKIEQEYNKHPIVKLIKLITDTPSTFKTYHIPFWIYDDNQRLGYTVFIDDISISFNDNNFLCIGQYDKSKKYQYGYNEGEILKMQLSDIELKTNYIPEAKLVNTIIDNYNKQTEKEKSNTLEVLLTKAYNESNYAFIDDEKNKTLVN